MPAHNFTVQMGRSYGDPKKVSLFHSHETVYRTDLHLDINNMTLANIMKDYYLGFVLNLDPNSVSNSGTPKPQWPQYSPAGATDFTVMDVNYTMMGAIPDMDANARCDFFHSQSFVIRN